MDMVAHIEEIMRQSRAAFDIWCRSRSRRWHATSDLLTIRLGAHEKTAWMLRAMLGRVVLRSFTLTQLQYVMAPTRLVTSVGCEKTALYRSNAILQIQNSKKSGPRVFLTAPNNHHRNRDWRESYRAARKVLNEANILESLVTEEVRCTVRLRLALSQLWRLTYSSFVSCDLKEFPKFNWSRSRLFTEISFDNDWRVIELWNSLRIAGTNRGIGQPPSWDNANLKRTVHLHLPRWPTIQGYWLHSEPYEPAR